MKLTYEAFSPADDVEGALRERIAVGEFDLPDDAGAQAILGALENAVEKQAAVGSGSQVRVEATVDGEPVVHHTWDHT